MKDICKLDYNNPNSDCNGSKQKSEKIAFGFQNPKKKLSKADIKKKNDVKYQMISATKKCIDNGYCGDLEIVGLRWNKCEVCDEHLPKLMKEVITPLKSANIPVHYMELDAKSEEGRDLFLKSGCQGTPCILIKSPNGKYKKAYDGRQESIGAMSNILGINNPLFYGNVSNEIPKNFVKEKRRFLIENNRSMWL